MVSILVDSFFIRRLSLILVMLKTTILSRHTPLLSQHNTTVSVVVSQVIPIMLSGRQPLSGRFEESVSLIGLEVVTSSSLGHSVVALIGRPNCTNQSQCREGGHYI